MKPVTVLMLLALVDAAGADPVWKQDENRSLELTDGDKTLARFQLACAPLDPHFEVLATTGGHNMVWVGPPDHVWHYGLWFSWKLINGVNFWETDPKTREQQGRNVVLEPKITSRPDGESARVTYRERSLPDAQGPAVLEDKVEIIIHKPKGDEGVRVEWNMTTTALEAVILNRTPPPGDEPGAKEYGGYGGFSWRGAKELSEIHYMDSEQRKDEAIHRQHATWVSVNGLIHEQKAGLLVVPHPANPRQPSSWYVTSNGKLPFWYVNPAMLQDAPLKMTKDQTMRHRYLLIIHDGKWTAERCAKAAVHFATALTE